MSTAPAADRSDDGFTHTAAFRARRTLNWFPLGLAYAMLYMGRYNLTVAKASLGDLMTKEDFGFIFGTGTFVYAFSFFLNGPLVDRRGGRFGMLVGVFGACIANVLMGLYLRHVLIAGGDTSALRWVFAGLYGANMYFQSFGAVSIVKVNAHWFHVRERGGFSGIFGTMISSGIFLAFSVNGWILDVASKAWPTERMQWIVFMAPAACLAVMGAIELVLLRDAPSQAGHPDFDTGDASSGEEETPLSNVELFKRLLKQPVVITVGLVELCTGVLRNGVTQWFPIYAKEVWVLPSAHPLVNGTWSALLLLVAVALGIGLNVFISRVTTGTLRRGLLTVVSLCALAPFMVAGWGGLLFVAGVVGANAAGWVSDLFFQSRRGPAALFLYVTLLVASVVMVFSLGRPEAVVETPHKDSGLLAQDRILDVEGTPVARWEDLRPVVGCIVPECVDSHWDADACTCVSGVAGPPAARNDHPGKIAMRVERGGSVVQVMVNDPLPRQRAGDHRLLKDQPVLPLSPWILGMIIFVMSLGVIGTHGLLSGTATMDFGGRRAAATAVGVIDGFVYLGTAVQAVALGAITSHNWAGWPLFMVPFALVGTLLLTRLWNAKPRPGAAH